MFDNIARSPKQKKKCFIKENLRYNDSVCHQRFSSKIEYAVIKKLDMDPSKARITDIFEHFFIIKHTFVYFFESPRREHQ